MHPHPLLLVAAHVLIADDPGDEEGDEDGGRGVASAMEGVQLDDGAGGRPPPGLAGALA